MKTLIIIIGLLSTACCILFLITNYILEMKNCKLKRFWTRNVCSYEKEEPVQFNHIKIVALDNKIRVFNRWGNWLCDVNENGFCVAKSEPTLLESNDIFYLQDHYLEIYKQLEKWNN